MPPSGPVPEESEDDKQGPIIPVEILRMDDKSLQLYKKALHEGKEKVYNLRVMVVGQFGVGKTTLTKRLLGKEVDISERQSTEGIDVYKHCCKISLDTGEWIVQHEDSDQLSRLQRLLKLLTGPDLKSDVSQEQEGHREVVYERETTPEADNTHMSDTASSSSSDQEDQLTYSKPVNLSVFKMDSGYGVAHSDQETSTGTVTKSEADSSTNEKKDAVIEILCLINENADKIEKDTVKYAVLSIWDFAGQYAFYTTHQTFLSSRALYLLVIDLNQQITDLIEDDKCFLDMEGIKPCKVHDLVEIWLNSIHTCASSPEASIPHVILVGTHVDKLSKKSRKKVIDNYFKELHYILKDKPTIHHLMDDIAIDNTQSDPMLEILKRKIFELARQQPHWGEERPARWLFLEQVIMSLRASGAKVVARSLIEEINMSGSVRIEDTDELDLFLRFHHDMGTILYFSVEGLREKIVLDPLWLIDALKSLITAETFIKKYPAITSKWYEFKETGKLTHELIDAIWTEKNHQEFHDNKDHILPLMEKLNIIARPRSFTDKGNEAKVENYFLAPCMLHQKCPREVTSPDQDPRIVSTLDLSCEFTGKFLPPPIFHRLLAACVAHWPVARNKVTSKSLIFCGSCVFDLDLFHRLTLYYRNHVICARITRMVIDEIRTPDTKLCSRVRKFITLNLSKIISYHGQNLQYALHVQSPPSQGVPEARMFQMWFTDEEHDPDAPITPEHMNHARLCVALVTVCGNAMREILLSNFPMPYKDIYQAILANKVTLTRKQGRPLLNSDQVQLVFPDPQGQKTGTVDQFDISLLYTLIRNISTVTAPLLGWGNDPQNQPRDSSLGASVERIRSYRNHISGHTADGKISRKEFEDYWNNIDTVLHDIESIIGRQVYSPELAKQKSQVISIYQAW